MPLSTEPTDLMSESPGLRRAGRPFPFSESTIGSGLVPDLLGPTGRPRSAAGSSIDLERRGVLRPLGDFGVSFGSMATLRRGTGPADLLLCRASERTTGRSRGSCLPLIIFFLLASSEAIEPPGASFLNPFQSGLELMTNSNFPLSECSTVSDREPGPADFARPLGGVP